MRTVAVYISVLISCTLIGCRAHAENHGYIVRTHGQSLVQIARDIYNDERMWNQIAYWNGIQPPYALHLGQILALKIAPVNPVANESLVKAEFAPQQKWPDISRHLEHEGASAFYVVNERAPSLSMVARDLYGDLKMVGKLAEWNGLLANAKLRLGKRLRLEQSPTLSSAEGTAALIQNWREKGNLRMVSRLGGSESGNVVAVSKKAKVKSMKAAHVSKPPIACTPTAAPASTPMSVAAPAPVSTAGTEVVDRDPQSSLRVDQDKDGIPASHKLESYWLGDDANRLIELIDAKLQLLKGNFKKHRRP